MWKEVFKTVRQAMKSWGGVRRFAVCIAVLTLAAVVLLWVSSHHPSEYYPTPTSITSHATAAQTAAPDQPGVISIPKSCDSERMCM
jgi:hypothetical protein